MTIKEIKDLLVGAELDNYGHVYVEALEKVEEMYGQRGLKSQVLYILCNTKFSDKENKKKLADFAKSGIN